MSIIEKLTEHTVYESPQSQQGPVHARFPGMVQLPSGELLVMYEISEEIDNSGAQMYISRSEDLGKTWQFQGPMYDIEELEPDFGVINETLKPTLLDDGTLIAMGYRFSRRSEQEPLVNRQTNGLQSGNNVVSFSRDDGITWSVPKCIDHEYPEVIETSGPCLQLRSGDLLATGKPFRLWDGANPTGQVGVLFRSRDRGVSWDCSERFYLDTVNETSPSESRSCQMPDGRVVVLVWAYNMARGTQYSNRVVVSPDEGRSFSNIIDTSLMGQASNLMALKDDLLLTIHAHRAGEVGLYVRLVDFIGDKWKVLEETVIWGKAKAQDTSKSIAAQWKSLQFGQPSLLQLNNGQILATHWCKEDGLAIIKTHRLKVTL